MESDNQQWTQDKRALARTLIRLGDNLGKELCQRIVNENKLQNLFKQCTEFPDKQKLHSAFFYSFFPKIIKAAMPVDQKFDVILTISSSKYPDKSNELIYQMLVNHKL